MDAPDAVSGLLRQYTPTRDVDVRNSLVLQFQTYAVAQEMQIPVQELRKVYGKMACTSLASIDELGGIDERARLPAGVFEDEATREAQMDAVKDLAERNRIIIAQAV